VHSIKASREISAYGALYRDAVSLDAKLKAGDYSTDQPELAIFLAEWKMVLSEMGEIDTDSSANRQ
jgi:hypothetical protein